MGIPRLFGYLVRWHAAAIRRGVDLGACDALYLDFNAIVHCAARSVLEERGGTLEREALEREIVARAIARAEALATAARPARLLYVAVDGAAPRAKQRQQRARRFQAEPDHDWDRNAITAGTAFMDALDAALLAWAQAAGVGRPRVEVSPSSEPGEGEQKIFAQLRAGRPEAGAGVVCVHGQDADLLVMALLLPPPLRERVRVVRESQHSEDTVDVVHAGALAQSVLVARPRAPRTVRDFAVLCLLMGNDFLPGLPALGPADGGMEALLAAHARAGSPPLAEGGPDALGGLRLDSLLSVLQAVAETEDARVAHADWRYYDAAARGVLGFEAEPRVVRPGEGAGWRVRYFRHLFGVRAPDAGVVREVCVSYVAALAWAVEYMSTGRVLSQGHAYPHVHAPTCLDLCHALADARELARRAAEELEATDRAFRPPSAAHRGAARAWQLLLGLPPASSALLPADADYARVMTDPRLGCAHAFPQAFALDAYLRHQAWERVPRLPGLDPSAARAAVEAVVGGGLRPGPALGQAAFPSK